MKIFMLGAHGNMARRYTAILKYLGHEVHGFDVPGFTEKHPLAEQVKVDAITADAVIVATPTDTHAKLLSFLSDCTRPILCEKPISKDLHELERVLSECKSKGARLQMVSQYDYLVDAESKGDTIYDYYKSGADGIEWDCINILYHAKGSVTLRNESPVWTCTINGQPLNIRDMDHAYVEMLDHWLRDPTRTDYDRIWEAHKKAATWTMLM